MKKLFINSCVLLLLFNTQVMSQKENLDQEIYMKAKTCCIDQKWDEAIAEFQKLIDTYPKSNYVDDAFFWIGYCLERIPDMQSEAFMQFDYLINKFPNSTWTDDAIIHQITIAEELYMSGNKQYKSFIKKFLKSKNHDIKNRAALSLGRLNDKSALPVLQEIKKDDDLGMMATSIIAFLNKADSVGAEQISSQSSGKTMNLIYKEEKIKRAKEDDDTDFFSFLNTQRYEQYKSMLRKDNDWSKEELQNFGLWHILDTDKFQEYFVLSNEYDRKEWLRKYWRQNDPTPTTEINERKEEFDRRVTHARAHFSAFWNYNKMKYLPDQHLRHGWDHAPWDARGELYIKYGEPDIRSIEGWHTEEWIYYNYGVDFLVKQYLTNIYGNAIKGGELSRQRFGDDFLGRLDNTWLPKLQSEFIFNNEMRFQYNYNAEPIEDLEIDVNPQNGGLMIEYQVPSNEFKKDKIILYSEEIVVFNNDEREIWRKSNQREVDRATKNITQKINVILPKGDYSLAIRIKDNHSKKMGIYKFNSRIE